MAFSLQYEAVLDQPGTYGPILTVYDNKYHNYGVLINGDVDGLVFTVEPTGGGSTRVEVTTNSVDTILNDPANVVWVPWPDGDVTTKTANHCTRVSAFRIIVNSGQAKVSVIGK